MNSSIGLPQKQVKTALVDNVISVKTSTLAYPGINTDVHVLLGYNGPALRRLFQELKGQEKALSTYLAHEPFVAHLVFSPSVPGQKLDCFDLSENILLIVKTF